MRSSSKLGLVVVGFLLGQAVPFGCQPITVTTDGGRGLSDVAPSPADAQTRTVELRGTCNRGEVLVFDGERSATCAELSELAFPRCDSGQFLTTSGGRLSCVGGSTTPWGVEGLLPDCSSGEILVSEGFGRWRCSER